MPETQSADRRRVTIPVKIAKVDEEKRLVRGIATQEIRDAHNEIVDYESVKAVLPGWRGNIREMHQPKAVGKAGEILADDALKALVVEAYISKGAPDTWEKVKDGTLSMFSIGGYGDRITNKLADGS